MSKQTAVEWLVKKIHEKLPSYELLNFDQKFYFSELVKQAKEMEKEQRIQDMSKMQIISDVDFDGNVTFMFSAKDYYNETYKGGEK